MPGDLFFAEADPEILPLDIRGHFEALTETEKFYAHWMSRAAFEGARIILRQNSAESEAIFDLILELYRQCDGDWNGLALRQGVGDDVLKWFLEYASMFLANLGNYASFNGKKFYPMLELEDFKCLAAVSKAAEALFDGVAEQVYSGTKAVLGYPDADGEVFSNYYPETHHLTKEETTAVQDFLDSQGVLTENTRLRSQHDDDGTVVHELLIASEEIDPNGTHTLLDIPVSDDAPGVKRKLRVIRGDHSESMKRINKCIEEAQKYVSNDLQGEMLRAHVQGFKSGDIDMHKIAQARWVQDRSPAVDCLLGFIEYYGDPHGVRAEWRGFVLLQNKTETRMLGELVRKADVFLRFLPWNGDGKSPLENERFESPDFTSMEALAFVSSSIPAGTNAPNFPDLRAQYGFKNLEIRNRLVELPSGQVSFLTPEDSELYSELATKSFGMLTALHELFGHGSGRHLAEIAPGEFNFNIDDPPISPLTGQPLSSWYKAGETFKSVFGWSYEECRCELVGLYLSFFPEVMEVFSFSESVKKEDVIYMEFLYIARSGVLGLASWRPETDVWGSAYGRARYVILMKLVQAGIARVQVSDDDVTVTLDRERLKSDGRIVIGRLLLEMHVHICAADTAGVALYDALSEVTDEMRAIRPLVVRKGTKQKQVLQSTTFIEDGVVRLREYKASPAGMIRSWAERYL